MMIDALLILAAYLAGSVSTAILVCRLLGLPDPRTMGSRNPGATNVLRLGGKKAAALTLVGDFLKGTLPVLVVVMLDRGHGVVALAGLAAFIGHLHPVFFGFIGGKGVATGLGVLLAWSWPALLATVATWLAMAALFRYSSLSALTAFALAPLYLVWLSDNTALLPAMLAITAATFWRHRSNIRNLLNGQEKRIGVKRPDEAE